MTFDAEHMLDNAAAVSQHRPMVEDRVLRDATLRAVKQFIEQNWACTSRDLIDHLDETIARYQ
jgi:hypothetical protein